LRGNDLVEPVGDLSLGEAVRDPERQQCAEASRLSQVGRDLPVRPVPFAQVCTQARQFLTLAAVPSAHTMPPDPS
jgi:hypothetical protein